MAFYRIERGGRWWASSTWTPRAAGKRAAAPGWTTCAHAGCARYHASCKPRWRHLVCNFADRRGQASPLLTHDDVITLFHEFGHGLHHMLTQVNERDVSGISGVEWDAGRAAQPVHGELLLGMGVLQPHDVPMWTRAHRCRALFDKMVAGQTSKAACRPAPDRVCAVRHAAARTRAGDDFMALLDQVRAEVAVMQPPGLQPQPHTFSHIFAGGYAAGYYSYKWAEVLSADAYAAFEKPPRRQPNPKLGRYRHPRSQGQPPAMESFRPSVVREPSADALLRHQGMAWQLAEPGTFVEQQRSHPIEAHHRRPHVRCPPALAACAAGALLLPPHQGPLHRTLHRGRQSGQSFRPPPADKVLELHRAFQRRPRLVAPLPLSYAR